MTDVLPEHETERSIAIAIQSSATNMGLSLIDIATVLHVFKQTGAPPVLIDCLESAINQISEAGGTLAAAQVGLNAMREERDIALETLAQLQHDMEIFNRNNPAVAALIDEVWVTAERDTLKRVNRRNRGA